MILCQKKWVTVGFIGYHTKKERVKNKENKMLLVKRPNGIEFVKHMTQPLKSYASL